MRYILLTLSLLLIGWIGSWSQAIKRGNTHYETGAYDAAVEAYQAAAIDRPEDPISHYNLGTALYQKKQFEKAADQFRRSLDVTDPTYRAQGYYNLGNAQIQLNDIAGAIRSYKGALRLNPTDLDAKHNLELALEKSESGEGNKDQQEQEQQQQNQQNSNEQQSNQQNQENPAASEGQNQESSEQEPTSEESASQLEQESVQPPVEMSKEDAIRLLDAVKDDEKEIQKKILQKRFSRRQRPEKDW